MFNGKKIESLEQSVTTLTEELNSEKEAIRNLLECLKNTDEDLNRLQCEKNELEKTFYNYTIKVGEEFTNLYQNQADEADFVKREVENLRKYIGELAEKYSSADETHNEQLKALKQSADVLVKRCEDIQLSNVQIMNQHNDMIKRYEASIKGYAEQTERMRENVLKKMNAKNIISVVEE